MLFDKSLTFSSMGLDHRLLKSIAGQGFARPTLVQSSCVKLALEARDVLVRAKTGSGKTLAYAIPIVQNILVNLERTPPVSGLAAIVLVPTRELVLQVKQAFDRLIHYCDSIVKVVHLVGDEDIKIQAMQLRDEPAIIVATPARLVEHCHNGSVIGIQDKLRMLVVDEADLVLSYGYEADVRALIGFLPKVHQSLLLSATLSPELEALKALVLHNPAVVKLAEQEGEGKLTQFWIECASTDKYLLVYALLKLQIISGKILFFVNSVESCFRLKLFLERFSIGSAVLNAELPANSRQSIITQFNRGAFNHLICTDSSLEWEEQKKDESAKPKLEVQEEEKQGDGSAPAQPAAQPEPLEAAISPRVVKGRKKKQNYGVSRGLDFKDVQVVVNVDFPTTAKSYVHRVGRTGRGGKSGEALSLVSAAEQEALHLVLAYQKALREEVAEPNAEADLKLLQFNMRDVDAFRYRVEDVSRSVTSLLVKEARLKEIRTELLNSEKLKAHFEDNPRELQLLKHDKVLHGKAVQPHLAKIPEYLKPKGFQGESSSAALQAKRKTKRGTRHVGSKKRKTEDPLTSFEFTSSQSKKTQPIPIVVPPTTERRFDSRVGFSQSTAGRRKWKTQHPTGKNQKSARQKKSSEDGPIYAS